MSATIDDVNARRQRLLERQREREAKKRARDAEAENSAIDDNSPPEPGDPGPIAEALQAEWPELIPLSADHELPQFPTDALPDVIRQFVEAEAEATQTPADLVAMLALSVISTACAKRIEIEAADGWIEFACVYLIVALEPGNRKSQVARDTMAPLVAAEMKLRDELAPTVRDTAVKRRTLERAINEAEKRAAKAEDENERKLHLHEAQKLATDLAETPAIELPRLTADDATPEALGALMAANGERIGIISGESDIFELVAGRYSKGTPNLGLFLAGHAGDHHRVDRTGRPSIHLRKPAITIGVSTQPDVVRGLAEKPGFGGRGLLARILYALPKSPLGYRRIDPPPVARHVRANYERAIAGLIDELGLPDGKPPRRLYLSPDARNALTAYREEIEPQLRPGEGMSAIAGWASKLPGACVRIAGLMHAVAEPAEMPELIPGATMAAAIAIGRYLTAHAVAAFDEMGAVQEIADARYIAAWLRTERPKVITLRSVRIKHRGRLKTEDRTRAAIDVLLDHGIVRAMPTEPREGPGRKPSPSYEVRPEFWATGPTPKIPKMPKTPISGNSGNSGTVYSSEGVLSTGDKQATREAGQP